MTTALPVRIDAVRFNAAKFRPVDFPLVGLEEPRRSAEVGFEYHVDGVPAGMAVIEFEGVPVGLARPLEARGSILASVDIRGPGNASLGLRVDGQLVFVKNLMFTMEADRQRLTSNSLKLSRKQRRAMRKKIGTRQPAFPRKVVGRVGRCIYCRTTEGPLGDEHIVPYSLGGNLVLEEASCRACAAITQAFEEVIARRMLLLQRTMFGLPTRRPKERPSTFPLQVTVNGTVETVDLPVQDHLPILPLPIYPPPTVFVLRAYEDSIPIIGVSLCRILNDAEEDLNARFGEDNWRLTMEIPGEEWARMIAKIGYGFAVARYGLDAFANVYVSPAILGESNDIGRWVGCLEEPPKGSDDGLHSLQVGFYGGKVTAHVRLFAQFGSPEYVVALGDVSPGVKIELQGRA